MRTHAQHCNTTQRVYMFSFTLRASQMRHTYELLVVM
jgi:hypothetical protein